MTDTMQLGDYNFKVIVNVKNSDGSARDLTGATNLKMKLRASASPSIVRTFDAVAENLAQGAVSYTVGQGVVDALGDWEAQVTWTLSAVPGQSEWVTVFTVIGSGSSELKFAQLFCSVADLVADKQAPGIDEERMYRAIREASDFVQKEIGWFIPVTLTRTLRGSGSAKLFVPPLLAITSISNYFESDSPIALTSSDYLLQPDNRFWLDGPYAQIVLNPLGNSGECWSRYPNGVQIAGRWGLYGKYELLDAEVDDINYQDDSQLTLKVSDGGKVSPGMVLLIGDEQELVTGWSTPTTSVTAINMASGMSVSDEVLTVDDATFLHVGEVICAGFEQMRIRDIQGNDCEVIRGWNGTRKATHANDLAIDVYRTVKVERAVNGTSAAAHANGAPLARYLVPDDILYLTKEIATLSANKALGGYQGRTGNAETGVVFYNDAFPRFDIETVKSNYHIPRLG